MSALSFVSATVNDSAQCKVEDPSTRETLTYDLRVMDASLQFINELLRNMLDINRSASKQMKLDFTVVDVLRDILGTCGNGPRTRKTTDSGCCFFAALAS